jgi:magnesium chelatase subunit D
MTMVVSRPVYPFSALVGQEHLKQALLLNAVNPRIGGVLIRGEKGTAKSTAVRGLARLLPPIPVVRGCPYTCSPEYPAGLCPVCTGSHSPGEPLPSNLQPTRLVELPVSASEDRVVGSLDLEHAITEGQRRFEPGLLAQVNQGLLYVDEVNLLDDHLVDLLLDAAAMGVNTVEREGISISHPARFILVGTMNPEEGELRPQLLDRFGLAVEIRGLTDVASRVAVMERWMAFEADPEGFVAHWHAEEQALSHRIATAQTLLPHVCIEKFHMAAVATLSLELDVDGHRADLTILETARTHAAWEGRTTLTPDDIHRAAELALFHRMRRHPFVDVGDQRDAITAAMEQSRRLLQDVAREQEDQEKKNRLRGDETTDVAPDAEWDSAPRVAVVSASEPSPGQQETGEAPTEDMTSETGEVFRPRQLAGEGDGRQRRAAGRRSRTRTTRKQGRYVSSRRTDRVTDLALDATLREAAPHQRRRREAQQKAHQETRCQPGASLLPVGHSDSPFSALPSLAVPSPPTASDAAREEGEISTPQHPERRMILWRDDLRQKVRVRQTRNAVCFVVDASWSMAAEERMRATRAAVLSLLRDAYQRRDHVGLVSFQRSYATVLLPLTSSVELAQERLQTMLVGGQTPLARGLLSGFELLDRACKRDPETIPLMVVMTDGQANVAMSHLPPQLESYRVAEMIARHQVRAIVIDTESCPLDDGMSSGGFISAHASRVNLKYTALEQGLARQLADHLQGDYYRLDDLRAGDLAEMVRTRMDGGNPGNPRR